MAASCIRWFVTLLDDGMVLPCGTFYYPLCQLTGMCVCHACADCADCAGMQGGGCACQVRRQAPRTPAAR